MKQTAWDSLKCNNNSVLNDLFIVLALNKKQVISKLDHAHTS